MSVVEIQQVEDAASVRQRVGGRNVTRHLYPAKQYDRRIFNATVATTSPSRDINVCKLCGALYRAQHPNPSTTANYFPCSL